MATDSSAEDSRILRQKEAERKRVAQAIERAKSRVAYTGKWAGRKARMDARQRKYYA